MPCRAKGSDRCTGPMAALSSHPYVCVTIPVVWIRFRPNKLWKLDYLVSQLSLFAHSGFKKQASSVGPGRMLSCPGDASLAYACDSMRTCCATELARDRAAQATYVSQAEHRLAEGCCIDSDPWESECYRKLRWIGSSLSSNRRGPRTETRRMRDVDKYLPG